MENNDFVELVRLQSNFVIQFIHRKSPNAAASLFWLENNLPKEASIEMREGYWKVKFQENITKTSQNPSFCAVFQRWKERELKERAVVLFDLKSCKCIRLNVDGHEQSAFRCVPTEEVSRPVQATNDNVSDGGMDTAQFPMHDLQINGHNKEHYQRQLRTEVPIATSLSNASKDTPRAPFTPTAPPSVQVPDRTNVRYPEYIDLNVREESFRYHEGASNWPHDESVQDKNVLVSRGFFFTGQSDLCRCYQCGLGLKDWASEDDILLEHLRHSSNCSHITRTVDPNMINVYRRKIQQSNVAGVAASSMPGAGSPTTMRHPEYEQYQVRLASFNRWPSEFMQTPEMLAEAGFFHTGKGDVVRCYYCDGGLQRWDAGDHPWELHARYFPTCTHVVKEKGEMYIRLVQAATVKEYHEINSEIPIDTEPAKKVIELGYSKRAVTMAIEECRYINLPLTAENMVDILLDKQDRGEELPTDEHAALASRMSQFDELTMRGLLEEREHLRSQLMCIRCTDRECNMLFIPCGHHKMCIECAHNVEICPICSKKIMQKIITRMS